MANLLGGDRAKLEAVAKVFGATTRLLLPRFVTGSSRLAGKLFPLDLQEPGK